MNTNNLSALIFLLAALLSQASAQNFVKVYNQPSGIGQVVSEDPEGYTIGTLVRETNTDYIHNFHLFKTNKIGKIISQVVVGNLLIPYQEFQNQRNPVIFKTTDSGFIILEADRSRYTGIKLLKLDYSGNILWNKTIDTSNTYALSYQVFSFIEGKDKTFYLLTVDDEEDLLIKTDSTGNIIYRKKFPALSSTYGRRALGEFSDGTLIAGAKNKLFWFDQDGNILRESEPLPYDIRLILVEPNDEMIVVSNGQRIEKYDRNGNSIWSVQTAHAAYSIKTTKDGGFITIQAGNYPLQYLSKLEESGNTEWVIKLDGFMKDVIETSDNGFAVMGSYWFAHPDYPTLPMILKTNSIGSYQGVSLVFPHKSIGAASTQVIGWLSEGVNAVDLQYSTNSGGTWKELANSILADQEYFTWEVPFELSDNCLMKISDAENSSYSDQSDSLFAITPPNMDHEVYSG